jgi:hypothetical protein
MIFSFFESCQVQNFIYSFDFYEKKTATKNETLILLCFE